MELKVSAPTRGQTYEVIEFVVETGSALDDPFRVGRLVGEFSGPDGDQRPHGFCDTLEGSAFRLRWMAERVGTVRYRLTFDGQQIAAGDLEIGAGTSPGVVRADGWGFRFSGSNEPFVWNATTTYLMPGLSPEGQRAALNRLARLGVNRIRVSLASTRQLNGGRWGEPQVRPRADFSFHYAPWPQSQPESQAEPQFDVNRFDVAYWQRFDVLVAHARKLGIQVQVIFFTDAQEDQNYPFDRAAYGLDANEERYYRYAVARLAAFSNVEWCLTNEWALYRPDESVDELGARVAAMDPHRHLLSVHGHGHFPFRTSPWCTHALFQVWDEEGGYAWMRRMRDEQAATGRVIPQVNEEYGYEDHYPVPWGGGKVAPARASDNRRRLAWMIMMAGGHQTTGESAANGLGGWINGAGDESMTMLDGYRHLRTFFESLPSADLEPFSDPDGHWFGLRGERVMAYYLPDGGEPPIADGPATSFNPRTGEFGGSYDGQGDWAYRVELHGVI